jgi:hypothetical protein
LPTTGGDFFNKFIKSKGSHQANRVSQGYSGLSSSFLTIFSHPILILFMKDSVNIREDKTRFSKISKFPF